MSDWTADMMTSLMMSMMTNVITAMTSITNSTSMTRMTRMTMHERTSAMEREASQ